MSKRTFPGLATIFAILFLLSGCATAVPSGEEPPSSPPDTGDALAGTAWVLDSMGGEAADDSTVMTLQFASDGTLSGSGGCNRFNGAFTAVGEDIAIEPLATTMMACEPAVMEQETLFLTALQGAKSFAVNGAKLTLSDASGIELLLFVAQSNELPGSAWVVTGYNDGLGVSSPLLDTVVEVSFGEDGNISGSGGCNGFTGNFTAEAGTLSIERLASTKKLCTEPDGVMEQEAALMAALESATAYSMEGPDLTLTRTDGSTAVTLTRG